ncbi:MAG TPA: DUF3352 domain-containing protein [Thermoleophilaceae bacterium]
MRRLALLALLVPLIAACGCGSDKGSSSPLDGSLRYLPANAPFAVAIDTDLNDGQYKSAGKIADRFPFAGAAENELEKLFERGGDVDFDQDVKPLLGNPFVVGAVDPAHFNGDAYVGAIEVKDKSKLEDLVKKGGAQQKGEKSGAKVYEDRTGNSYAIEDDVLLVAGSRKLLDEALDRRDGDDTLTEDKFDSALEGLPKDSLVRSYFNLESLLRATPGGRQATKVKWVGALRTLGLVAQARDDSVSIPFDLKTDPDGLTDKDLPVASGDTSPQVVQRAGEFAVGLRDLGHVVDFSIDAARATQGPAIDVGKTQLEHQLGIDVERDISDQLKGDTSVVITPSGDFGVRAELKDPAAFEKTLAKVAGTLPSVLAGVGASSVKLSKPRGGSDFYTLSQADGTSTVFGVSHNVLVVSNSAAGARSLAAAKPASVPGAKGSIVMSADAEKLVNSLLDRLSSLGLLGSFGVTKPLGQLTGSAQTSTSGMKGTLELSFD